MSRLLRYEVTMEYRELGQTGLRVSVVGYGTAPLGDGFAVNDEQAALQSAYRALRSFLANQYPIQRSGCATTLIGTAKERYIDSAVRAAEEPIDEELLAAVLDAIGSVRGRHWTPWPSQMS